MDWIDMIQKAIDEIELHIEEKMDADSLSEKLYVSSYYFQKCSQLYVTVQ